MNLITRQETRFRARLNLLNGLSFGLIIIADNNHFEIAEMIRISISDVGSNE